MLQLFRIAIARRVLENRKGPLVATDERVETVRGEIAPLDNGAAARAAVG